MRWSMYKRGVDKMNYKEYKERLDALSKPKSQTDMVNQPPHYADNHLGIECIRAIEASMSPEEFKGMCKGNTIKYLWRYTYKGKPVEDLKKARYYLDALIERVEKET